MNNKHWFVILIMSLWSVVAPANNIQISNVAVTGDVPLGGYAFVTFDLSWENAWRDQNWDAAWVFVKYRVGGGEWRHAWLNDTGHEPGTGTDAVIENGLRDIKTAFNATTNPVLGVITYRNTAGRGYNVTGMKLRWNYGANGIIGYNTVEVKVFGIEMALVPGGSFNLGDVTSSNTFRRTSSTAAYQVSTTGSAVKVNNLNVYDDAQLEGTGIWLDGDDGISTSSATATNMNADFPTGFRGFYCMKYEISQGQYRDFLNTLNRAQQNLRTAADISGTTVINRYVMSNTSSLTNRNGLRCNGSLASTGPVEIYCDMDGDGVGNESTDGEWVACNYITWNDGAAYLDWAGLRPMTELEFEKACRGAEASLTGEYAWGTAAAVNASYTLSGSSTGSEGIATNYSSTAGNAAFDITVALNGAINGPLRVGIFAGNNANTGRVTSGAGFCGAMELSGNLWERTVTIGNTTGRGYTGTHGDGLLSSGGDADVTLWPGTNASGAGLRGGRWGSVLSNLKVSDRSNAARTYTIREAGIGFRGVRGIPASGSGY